MKTGTRVPMRMISMWGVSRARRRVVPERDGLAADRVARVVRVDEAHEVGRDVDAELVLGGEPLDLLLGQAQDRADLVDGVDPAGELPTPVVPLLVRHVRPQRSAPADRWLAVRPERASWIP